MEKIFFTPKSFEVNIRMDSVKIAKRLESGFSLVELLVVVSIVGILAGVSMGHLKEWRARGFDARAESDLKNGASAQHSEYADSERYIACASAENCAVQLDGITTFSKGTTLAFSSLDPASNFTGTATHPQGTGVVYSWDSANGGMQN